MTTFEARIVLLAAALLLASVPACTGGPGRCIGSIDTGAAGADAKVLVNLDKDGVAIQGYDPVAYFTEARPVKGDPGIRTQHGGAIYLFASPEHKQMFEAGPARYEPQFGGYCAYAASIDVISPIDPAFWEVVDGRLLLQHNQKAWDLWHQDPANNLTKADRNWPGLIERSGSPPRSLLNVDADGLALEGFDPTSYVLDGKPLRGDASLSRSYRGATYRFVDTEHKNAFERDPARFVPVCGGFCGYAASINKISPVNPEIWQIVDGHLVLQHTPEAFALFNRDVPGNYQKAMQNWPGLSHRCCN